MAAKTVNREIDGVPYCVIQLTPMKAIRLFTKVSKTLGPALKGMGKADLKGISDTVRSKEDVNMEDALGVLAGITEGLDEDKIDDLILSCLISDNVRQDGKPIANMDASFDNPMTILKVVILVLEVNFKDFLGGLGSSKVENP